MTGVTKQQSNYIKIMAILSMFIDHVGVIFFPQQVIFRIIGRIAFPLFAYQIGVGFTHTRNEKKYFLRLLLFGAAIQLFYMLVAPITGEYPWNLNIFFTLALGVAAIFSYERKWYILFLCMIIMPSVLTLTNSINVDYGTYGILLIFIMYAQKDDFRKLALYTTGLTFAFCFVVGSYIQVYCVAALLFIVKPFSLKAYIPSSVFYIFYPLHLAILYGISRWNIF